MEPNQVTREVLVESQHRGTEMLFCFFADPKVSAIALAAWCRGAKDALIPYRIQKLSAAMLATWRHGAKTQPKMGKCFLESFFVRFSLVSIKTQA